MVQGADNVVSDKRSSFRSGFVQLGWNSTTVFYGIGNCYVKEKNLSLMQHSSCVSFFSVSAKLKNANETTD